MLQTENSSNMSEISLRWHHRKNHPTSKHVDTKTQFTADKASWIYTFRVDEGVQTASRAAAVVAVPVTTSKNNNKSIGGGRTAITAIAASVASSPVHQGRKRARKRRRGGWKLVINIYIMWECK